MKKAVLTIGVLTACFLAAGFAAEPVATGSEQTSVELYKKTIMVSYLPAGAAQAPLEKAWPIGGSAPATLHTDGDLIFKGLVVPKGDYSLYLQADGSQWQLIFNKKTGPAAATYDASADLGRVSMILRNSSTATATCKVTLTKFAARAARLELALEKKVATAPFTLDWVPGEAEW